MAATRAEAVAKVEAKSRRRRDAGAFTRVDRRGGTAGEPSAARGAVEDQLMPMSLATSRTFLPGFLAQASMREPENASRFFQLSTASPDTPLK